MKSLTIYPNPVEDYLNLEFITEKAENDISIGIYDINLKLIRVFFKGSTEKGLNHYYLDLSAYNLVQGNYFIIISNSYSQIAHRIVKE
jgi:Secretion system C-terminal sorting domain